MLPTQNCRERYGESTCNKRRTFSELQSEFPNVVFEEGFEEEDVLWTSECENDENLERRAKLVLDGIFQKDCNDTCAITHCLSQVTKSSTVFQIYPSQRIAPGLKQFCEW
jgi:hypothetical protein